MGDGADYLKYVTERVVSYWETQEAPELRRERREKREPWTTRWFGQLLPVGIGMWLQDRRITDRTSRMHSRSPAE